VTRPLPKAPRLRPRGRACEGTRAGDAPETGAGSSVSAAFALMHVYRVGDHSPDKCFTCCIPCPVLPIPIEFQLPAGAKKEHFLPDFPFLTLLLRPPLQECRG